MTGPRGLPERKERKTNKSQPQIKKKGKTKERKDRKERKSQPQIAKKDKTNKKKGES